jgi:hypothetical protein
MKIKWRLFVGVNKLEIGEAKDSEPVKRDYHGSTLYALMKR